MQGYLVPFKQTVSGDIQLNEDEVILQNETDLTIYLGDVKKFHRGKCALTNMRIIWTSNDNSVKHAILLKTIKNPKDKSGAFKAPKIVFELKERDVVSIDKNNPNTPPKIKKLPVPHPGYMMLSFHSKGRDSFLMQLKKSLKLKAWKAQENIEEKRQFSAKNAGIKGILDEQKQKQKNTKTTVNEAFEDLESLMKHAKKMVNIANKIASSKEMNRNMSEFDKMLHDLGIQSPVTKEIAGSEYHKLLARQLCDFLNKILNDNGGMMTLTDIYCLYNKARGTELVSPDDLIQAMKLMPSLDLPMKLKSFKSGVIVCQLTKYNDKDFAKIIVDCINKSQGQINELKLANMTGISLELAREQLINAEELGYICRDESNEGLIFYNNIFKQYNKGVMRITMKKQLKAINKAKNANKIAVEQQQQQIQQQKKVIKQSEIIKPKKSTQNDIMNNDDDIEYEEQEPIKKKKKKKRVMMML